MNNANELYRMITNSLNVSQRYDKHKQFVQFVQFSSTTVAL